MLATDMKNIIHIILISLFCLAASCQPTRDGQYQGYVEADLIFLASPFSGELTKSLVHMGQAVKKGQLLFKLDDKPQILTFHQAQADLEQATRIYKDLQNPKRPEEIEAIVAQIAQTEEELELAQLRLTRFKTLYQKNAIDKHSVDEAEAHYDQLQKRKEQYQANLALAKLGSRSEQIQAQKANVARAYALMEKSQWDLAQKTIFAPKDGVIFDVYYEQGEFVAAQKPVASLLSPDDIRIDFFVPSEALASVKIGQEIAFTCNGCPANNKALIRYISEKAEYIPPLVYSQDNRDKLVFRIKAKPEYPKAFKPGQPITITHMHYEP